MSADAQLADSSKSAGDSSGSGSSASRGPAAVAASEASGTTVRMEHIRSSNADDAAVGFRDTAAAAAASSSSPSPSPAAPALPFHAPLNNQSASPSPDSVSGGTATAALPLRSSPNNHSSPSPDPAANCAVPLPLRSPLSTPSASPSPDSACFLDPATGEAFHYYLAIGSMINPTSLKLRKLAPIDSRPAILRGWRLVFRGDCGMASILECDSPLLAPIDPQVDPSLQHRYRCSAPPRPDFHGVLHRLSMDQMRKLDVIESSYDRLEVYVDLYDGTRQKATVYKMAEEKLDPSVPDALPSERYLDIICRGCVAFGVAPEYINWLRSHEMVRRKLPSEYKKIPVHALHQSGKGLHLTAELLAKYDGATLIPDAATQALANAMEKKRRQAVAAEAKRRKGLKGSATTNSAAAAPAIPSAIPAPVAVAPANTLVSPAPAPAPAPSASPSIPGLPSVSPPASTATPSSSTTANSWPESGSPAVSPASQAELSPSPDAVSSSSAATAAAAASAVASVSSSTSSSAATPAPSDSPSTSSGARYPLRIAVNAKVLEWIGDLSQPLLANTYEFMRYNFGGSDLTHAYTCVFFEPLYPIRSSYKDMSLEHRAMIEDIFYGKCFHPDPSQREWKLVGFLSREEQNTSQRVGRAKLRKNHRGGAARTAAGAAAAAAAAAVRDPSAPRAVLDAPTADDVDDESELRMPENLFLSLSMEDHSGASSTCFAFCCSGARPFNQQARALAYRATNAAAGAQRLGAALLARQAGAGGQAVSAIQQAEAKRKRRHSIGNVGLHAAAAAAAAAANSAPVCHCGAASAASSSAAPTVCTCVSHTPSSSADPAGSSSSGSAPVAWAGSQPVLGAGADPAAVTSTAASGIAATTAPVLRAPRPHLPTLPARPRLVRSASICSGMLEAFQRAAAAAESLQSPMSRAGGGGDDASANASAALSPSRRERRNSADGFTVRSPSAAAMAVSPTAASAIPRSFGSGLMMTSSPSRAISATGEMGTPAPSPVAVVRKH